MSSQLQEFEAIRYQEQPMGFVKSIYMGDHGVFFTAIVLTDDTYAYSLDDGESWSWKIAHSIQDLKHALSVELSQFV